MKVLAVAAVGVLLAGAAISYQPNGSARAQAELTTEEAVFAGQLGALVHLHATAMDDLAALSAEAAARWSDLAWQNDVIGESAVFDALREEADTLAPPARFAGSTAEFQEAFRAADRAGELVRQGIEAGDLDTFALAAPELAAADDRLDAALDILRDEGVTVSGVPAPDDATTVSDAGDADGAAYLDAATQIAADAAGTLARYRELAQAPRLTDDAWRQGMAVQVAAWDQAYQEAALLEPPAALEPAHAALVEALRRLAEAGAGVEAAVGNQDVAGIAAAGRDVEDAAAELDAATAGLDAAAAADGA